MVITNNFFHCWLPLCLYPNPDQQRRLFLFRRRSTVINIINVIHIIFGRPLFASPLISKKKKNVVQWRKKDKDEREKNTNAVQFNENELVPGI